MSLQPKSLFVRLALVGALGSLLSVFALGAYVAYEQGELATQSAYKESYLITSGLATALASDLIVKNYAGIDQTVNQITTRPNLDSLQVVNERGNIIVEARRDLKSGTWRFLHGHTVELPHDEGIHSSIADNRIVTWAPIVAGGLIGWVNSNMQLNQVRATRRQIFRDTFLVALLSVALSTLVVVIALRRPIKQIRRAANFAGDLPEKHGQTLIQSSSTSELQHLVSALNGASKKLHNQDQELKMLHALIEYSDDPVYILDVEDEFRMTFVNDAACRHYGMTREKLLSRRAPDLVADIDVKKLIKLWTQLKDSRHITFNSLHRIASGALIPVEISANYIRFGDRELVAGYFRDIRERVRVEQALRDSRDLAQQVAQSKSEFLANMSHEIRTPMNGIIGLTQLALNLPASPELRDYLGKIAGSSQSLLGILNDILDVSKLEAARMSIEQQVFDLDFMLDNLRNLFEEGAAFKHLDLIIDVAACTPRNLVGDTMRIQQIIANLLGNAIKFTEHGYVAVKVAVKKQESTQVLLAFSVEDTGIGIAREDFDKLFQPFSQVDGSITRKFGGTGLGLSISQSLLKLMGGEFRVESQPGLGTVFSFDLQLGIAAPGKLQKPLQRINAGELGRDLKNIGHNLQGAKILIVEDHKINQKVISEFLKLSGMETVIANNGQEALELLKQQDFDAILMDVQMPIMDGMEATRTIRSYPKYARLPVIALTAGVTQDEQKSYLACGMNDFLAKPINPEDLVSLLSRWVGKRYGDGFPPPEQPSLQANNQDETADWTDLAADLAADLPGFDLHNIMTILGGQREPLLRMLREFFEDFNGESATVINLVSNGQTEAAKTLLHTLKGVAGNLGAMKLHQACIMLDSQLTQDDFNAESLQIWLNAFDSTMLTIAAVTHIAPKVRAPVDTGKLMDALAELDGLLANDDFVDESLLARIEHAVSADKNALFQALSRHIYATNYQEARVVLKQLAGGADVIG